MSRYLYIAVIIFCLPTVVFGQWVVDEGFESGVPPTGWQSYQVEGDPWESSSYYIHSGSYSALHTYFESNENAWLITPACNLTGMSDPHLIYWELVEYGEYAEAHNVKISTDYPGSGDPSGSTWVVLNDVIGTELAWVEQSFSLSAYIGQTVYIAWQYTGYDASDWYIDDVMIGEEGAINIFPHLETFDHAGELADGWSNDTLDSGEDWLVVTAMDNGASSDYPTGTGYFLAVDDSSPHLTPTSIVSPPFDLTGLSVPVLSFYYYITYYQDYSNLEVDIYDGSTWHDAVVTLSRNVYWEQVQITLTPYVSNWTIFRFRGLEHGSNYFSDICLDYLSVYDLAAAPACSTVVHPTNLATDIPVSGFLSWNEVLGASGYRLYFGTNGAGVSDPTNIANNVNLGNVLSYNFEDLAYQTVHYWKIVPYNVLGDATGCSIWSFTTSTDPTIHSFPWLESFENSGEIPLHWKNDIGDSGENWFFTTGSTNSGDAEYGVADAGDHTTGTGYFAWVDDSASHVTPTLMTTLPLDIDELVTPTLTFWYWIGNTVEPYSTLNLDIWDGSTWNELIITDITANGMWSQYALNISDYKSSGTKIRFHALEGSSYQSDICLDDVSVFDAWLGPQHAINPNPADTAIDVNRRTDLSWQVGAGYSPTGYRISLWYVENSTNIYLCDDVDLGNVTSCDPSTCGYDVLDFDRLYYWQVIPYNAYGDAPGCPIWSFTVMSFPFVADYPWIIDFQEGVLLRYAWAVEGTEEWALDLNSGNYSALCEFYNWSSGAYSRLLTPFFDLTNVTKASLKFSYSHMHNAADDRLQVILTNGSLSYTLFDKTGADLDSNDGATGTTPGTYIPVYINIPSAALGSQNLWLEFIGTGAGGANLYIDDFELALHTVIINDVAWMGTNYSTADEWIELYNPTLNPINIATWSIDTGTGVPFNFSEASTIVTTIIPAKGSLVCASNANVFYSGATVHIADAEITFPDDGGEILLYDQQSGAGKIMSRLNDDGPWCGGLSSGAYAMERIDPFGLGDLCGNIGTNDGLTINGLDQDQNPVNGTPGEVNSQQVMLTVTKSSSNIILNWSPSVAAGPFSVFYNNTSPNTVTFDCLFKEAAPTVTLTGGVTDGKTYYFIIRQ
ncbi:choice-of-anchor J domain-containing protein [bacterium]|nr:choice-of-anchor J domain-containing protein [bacterium]